ncbi:isoprenyl transferase [Desulfuribacillus alkaliarsenatis]|uniref:Isoprenyl transferase n=1 Tax=Desulfuribacillus alkaliarsenatis TaxID=766136 RepID=A0A1E5G635_9FIRM|nr:isoprenyl transferase [Desulfuribacillus alkaliarsenatis]OEF98636.1 isoprenyl transferase [Desulfuribacillus alkaliarsenatis]
MRKYIEEIKAKFQKDDTTLKGLLVEKKDLLPKHIAMIMDGNGRWAKKRGLPRMAGHKAGMQTVKQITRESSNLGIEFLTLYAFSTENWKRPDDEVSFLMRLPEEYLQSELNELIKNNVQVKMIGNATQLPDYTRKAIEVAVNETKHNNGMVLNFALNYGSRLEIIEAVKEIAVEVRNGLLDVEDVVEETLESKLMTNGLPDPDLLIRTSGEMRLSNFLLWQLAYTEFYFTETLWPDFSVTEYYRVIHNYMKRARRYGGLN